MGKGSEGAQGTTLLPRPTPRKREGGWLGKPLSKDGRDGQGGESNEDGEGDSDRGGDGGKGGECGEGGRVTRVQPLTRMA